LNRKEQYNLLICDKNYIKIDKHAVKSIICKWMGSTFRHQASSILCNFEWDLHRI